MAEQAEDYYIPLEDQRVFGAGIKRKRIAFVPASSVSTTNDTTSAPPPSTPTVADRYLSIVGLPRAASAPAPAAAATTTTPSASSPEAPPLCPVCAAPIPLPLSPSSSHSHASTIAHQLSQPHSHPPSHLDRARAGARYLQSYGWDPDGRVGLGARADGVRFPLKAVPKHDTVGLRERGNEDGDVALWVRKGGRPKKKREGEGVTVRVSGDAKQVRKRDDEARKRAEKLRGVFYASDDVDKYLGDGG